MFGSQDIHSSTRFAGLRDDHAVPALARLVTRQVERQPLSSLLRAECVFLLGTNITDENPVSGYLLRTSMRDHKTRLIIASSRPSGLDDIAEASMHVLPGDEARLLSMMIMDQRQPSEGCIEDFVAAVAPIIAESTSMTLLIGTEFLRSSKATDCLRWIEKAVDHYIHLGKTVYVQFLFDRPNQLGLWDMGCLAGVLPGWKKGQLSPRIPDGPPDLLYVLGAEPVPYCPSDDKTEATSSRPACLVVHASHFGTNADQADVVLPAASYGEESGTFTNNEGRLQTLLPVRTPRQDQPSARQVFNLISDAWGQDPS